MKKLPLAIAFVSLFAASTGFSQDYYQSFEVSLDIPSSVNVEAFQMEQVNLSMDDLSEAMNGTGASIGSMNIQTTARHCMAVIDTDNQFKLRSHMGGGDLPYAVEYTGINSTGNSMTTKFSEMNMYQEQSVGCNVGDLKMRLSRMENGAMYGVYGTYSDVIHVMVRAES